MTRGGARGGAKAVWNQGHQADRDCIFCWSFRVKLLYQCLPLVKVIASSLCGKRKPFTES